MRDLTPNLLRAAKAHVSRAASQTRTWREDSTPAKADKWVYDHLTSHLRITVPA